jgi:drug/metabolite transporter (DMT)-like permease
MTKRGFILYVICGLAWGIPFYLVDIIVEELGPTMTVFLRITVGALILLPIAVRAGVLRKSLPYWKWILLFALLQLAIPWWLVANAQRQLESGMTSLLMTAIPLFTIIFARMSGDA